MCNNKKTPNLRQLYYIFDYQYVKELLCCFFSVFLFANKRKNSNRQLRFTKKHLFENVLFLQFLYSAILKMYAKK